jgi:hypothetical protein
MHRTHFRWLVSLLLIGLPSCVTATPTASPANLSGSAVHGAQVVRETHDAWAAAFSQMGLVSVYPPREDIRVGDVFLAHQDPGQIGRSLLCRGVRWASVPTRQSLEEEYSDRRPWPGTPPDFIQGGRHRDQPRRWPEPTSEAGASIFGADEAPDRLRMVGMDLLSSISFTSGSANTLVPTEAANLTDTISWAKDKAVSLRLGGTESYQLPMQLLLSQVVEETAGTTTVANPDGSTREITTTEWFLRQPYRDGLSLAAGGQKMARLHVLTEVLYMRTIDVSVQSKRSQPDSELASEPLMASAFYRGTGEGDEEDSPASEADEDGSDSGDADDESAGPDAPPGDERAADSDLADTPSEYESPSDHAIDPIYGAFVRAEAINRVLIESGVDDLPGGAVRFLSVTDDSVAMRRILPRGLAIAARGFTIEVDPSTSRVLTVRSGFGDN